MTQSAQLALTANEEGLARQRAEELLALVPKLDEHEVADAKHASHIVLGKVALRSGAINDATQELVRAAEVDGSAVLASYGPDLELARLLLERGQRDAVASYLARVATFWEQGRACVAKWRAAIETNEKPDFSARDCSE